MLYRALLHIARWRSQEKVMIWALCI